MLWAEKYNQPSEINAIRLSFVFPDKQTIFVICCVLFDFNLFLSNVQNVKVHGAMIHGAIFCGPDNLL